jgi:hypothetical protein
MNTLNYPPRIAFKLIAFGSKLILKMMFSLVAMTSTIFGGLAKRLFFPLAGSSPFSLWIIAPK